MATKVARIQTSNSKSIISYTGLGAKGTPDNEVSEWIKNSLKGYTLDYETLVNLLVLSARKRIMVDCHSFIMCGFVNGIGTVTNISKGSDYNIHVYDRRDSAGIPQAYSFPDISEFMGQTTSIGDKSVFISIVGSGDRHVTKSLRKQLTRIIKDAERSESLRNQRFRVGNVGAFAAHIIRLVSRSEITVSPESVAVFELVDGTGWQKVFDKFGSASEAIRIPTIGGGMPVDDIVSATTPYVLGLIQKSIEAEKAGLDPAVQIDPDEMKRLLSTISLRPDDSL